MNSLSAVMSEAELESIVKAAVKAKTHLDVAAVTFDYATRTTGYGQGEHDEVYFKGATIIFASGQEIKSAKVFSDDSDGSR